MYELVLGGARSGKSAYAERCATNSGLDVVYIATASAGDDEMTARIARHQAQRPPHWQTIESPIALAQTLTQHARTSRFILVDCLTLWLSNVLLSEDQTVWPAQRKSLLQVLPSLPGHVLLVSNEVGQGIVPLGEINRRFIDEAGWLHQDLAQLCDRVTWVVAGLPQPLKGA